MIRNSVKTLNRSVGNRQFWNLCRGKSIGFIESVYKAGWIIQTEYASFRETSSNLSNGDVREISISMLPEEYRAILDKALDKKIPIMIEFSKDWMGSPFKGDMFHSAYIHSIKILGDEIVNVKM